MQEIVTATTALRRAHGDRACAEALSQCWAARLRGEPERSNLLLSAAIRLCRPTRP